MGISYKSLAPLSPDEIGAAKAYASDAVGFHSLCQGIRLSKLHAQPDPLNISRFFPSLMIATDKFELTEDQTVYCGLGWGLPIFGSLGADDVNNYVGLTYQYGGFISTSELRDKAEHFLCSDISLTTDRPALLVMDLPAGFRGFPYEELGGAHTMERELLLPRNVKFTITRASEFDVQTICGKSHPIPAVELRMKPV